MWQKLKQAVSPVLNIVITKLGPSSEVFTIGVYVSSYFNSGAACWLCAG